MVEMDPHLEDLIVQLSMIHLDRPVCGCAHVEHYVDRWRDDLALVGEGSRYQVGQRDLYCPWGTMRGAIYAWKEAQDMALGRAVKY